MKSNNNFLLFWKKNKTFINLIVSSVLSLLLEIQMIHHFKWANLSNTIFLEPIFQMLVCLIVLFFAGRGFLISFIKRIKNFALGMDALIVLGAGAAFFFSIFQWIYYGILDNKISEHVGHEMHYYFDVAAVLVTLVYVGKYIEGYVSRRATNVLKDIADIEPKVAILKETGKQVETKDLKIHDLVIVKKGEKIPIDGYIYQGQTTVDESAITGEFLPALKKEGSDVIGGTINLGSQIIVSVTKLAKDTMIAEIINIVEMANLKKIKIQKLADKISSYFIPLIILISLIGFIVWITTDIYTIINSLGSNSLIYPGQTMKKDFVSAITVAITILVISCPCALGIATPLSILMGTSRGAKNGILFKSPSVFEKMKKIKAICFDKTGTLTIGKPKVISFFGSKENLSVVYGAEKLVSHPIAHSIMQFCKDNNFVAQDIKEVKEESGMGISFRWNDKEFKIGSLNYMMNMSSVFTREINDEIAKMKNLGQTLVLLSVENVVESVFGIADQIKENAKEVIANLKSKGYEIYMITGDHENSAKLIASQLGIDKYFYEVLPTEKYNYIKKIQAEGKQVAFVGDGVNDAPAIIQSDLGIAMGSGTSVAISASDVVILDNDLSSVQNVIILAKRTMRNIYSNFAWAFSYNLIAIPIAFLGLLNPLIASIFMIFSDLIVIFNSWKTRLYRLKRTKKYTEQKNLGELNVKSK